MKQVTGINGKRYMHPTEDREMTQEEYEKMTLILSLTDDELEFIKNEIESTGDSHGEV